MPSPGRARHEHCPSGSHHQRVCVRKGPAVVGGLLIQSLPSQGSGENQLSHCQGLCDLLFGVANRTGILWASGGCNLQTL